MDKITSTYEMNRIKESGNFVYYLDRFFAGDIANPFVFSVSIIKTKGFGEKEVNIDIGDIGGNGFKITLNLDDEEQRKEVLQIVSKLSEGFDNLLSALKKECRDG